jgi:predicted aldo/keto reductase-like oxidoreductase
MTTPTKKTLDRWREDAKKTECCDLMECFEYSPEGKRIITLIDHIEKLEPRLRRLF